MKTEIDLATARNLYASGLSLDSVGRRFGCSESTIRRLFTINDIPVRGARDLQRSRSPVREDAFETITEESAYWAGFLMADGCVTRRGNSTSVVLSLAARDVKHLERFKDFLKSSNSVRLHTHISGTPSNPNDRTPRLMAHFSVRSKRLAEGLARFGVVPRKTWNAEVKELAENRHFWRGFIDGDGTVGVYRDSKGLYRVPPCYICATVVPRRLIEQFCEFAAPIIGFKGTPRLESKRHSPGNEYWKFLFKHAAARKIIAALYANSYVALERKNLVAQSILQEGEERARRSAEWSANLRTAVAAYQVGNSIESIHERWGFARQVLRKAIGSEGVPLRSSAEARALCRKQAREQSPQSPEIVRLYLQGTGVRRLVKELGVAEPTIRAVLSDNGIALRSRSESAKSWRKIKLARKHAKAREIIARCETLRLHDQKHR